LDNNLATQAANFFGRSSIPQPFDHWLTDILGVVTLGELTEGINKDSMDCGFSPHGPTYHLAAVALAEKATINFVQQINASLTTKYGAPIADKYMRALFGVGTAISLVVDTTGSMSDIQAQVIAALTDALNKLVGTVNEPYWYILSPFNDPAVDVTQTSYDLAEFEADLGALGADGGGDCPEPGMQGLLNAMAHVDHGTNIFLVTDAQAKDPENIPNVIATATSLGTPITVFLFDSECSDQTAYGQVTDATGGQLFYLQRDEAQSVTTDIIKQLKSTLNPIATYSGNAGTGISARGLFPRATPGTFEFPIDPSMKTIYFSLSGASATLSMTITRPDGSIVASSDAGTSFNTLSGGIFVIVDAPAAGTWTIAVSGTGTYQLKITGDTTINFSFAWAQYVGRPDHAGWTTVSGFGPVTPGQSYPALAFLEGADTDNATDVGISLRDDAGRVLTNDASVSFIQGSGEPGFPSKKSYFGVITIPSSAQAAWIYVTGKDSAGHDFMRIMPAPLTLVASNGTAVNGTNSTSTPSSSSSSSSASSSAASTGFSAPYGNSSSTPQHSGMVDTTTVTVRSTVITCPIASTSWSGTHAVVTVVPTTSTIVKTYTGVIPCATGVGPNYGGSNAASASSLVYHIVSAVTSSPTATYASSMAPSKWHNFRG
jgi:hypothetical protein